MQTFHYLLVLLAIVAGISAGERPLKQQLLAKLEAYNAMANNRIDYYSEQGFNHYVNVLQIYQDELLTVFKKILPLEESAVEERKTEFLTLVTDTISSVDFENPDPYEALKALALYSCVQHRFNGFLTPLNYVEHVVNNITMIIEKENKIKTKNPMLMNNADKLELKDMYAVLEELISHSYTKNYSRFIEIANLTKQSIDALVEDGELEKAKAHNVTLNNFITLNHALAGELPLNRSDMIQNYFDLATKHYMLKNPLEILLSFSPNIKKRLFYRTEACLKTLNASRADFIHRGNDYFADRVLEGIKQAESLLKRIKELPYDVERTYFVNLMFMELKSLEKMTAYRVKNPEIKQTILAGVLYIAAEKLLLPTSENANINVTAIQEKIKQIVKSQNELKGRGGSTYERIYIKAQMDYIDGLYDELLEQIGDRKLPTFADNDELVNKSIAKIAEMRNHGMGYVADAWQKQLDMLQLRTFNLNKLFPLASDETVDGFLYVAKNHYYYALQLKFLLATNISNVTPKPETDNTTEFVIDCSNDRCKKHDRTTDN